MTDIIAGVVDVYIVRPLPDGWKVLAVQRSLDTRCPGAWETVHGRLEPGEKPEEGAVREIREETGLEVARLYNVTVQPFYRMASVQSRWRLFSRRRPTTRSREARPELRRSSSSPLEASSRFNLAA